jgi:hypothetical protein
VLRKQYEAILAEMARDAIRPKMTAAARDVLNAAGGPLPPPPGTGVPVDDAKECDGLGEGVVVGVTVELVVAVAVTVGEGVDARVAEVVGEGDCDAVATLGVDEGVAVEETVTVALREGVACTESSPLARRKVRRRIRSAPKARRRERKRVPHCHAKRGGRRFPQLPA